MDLLICNRLINLIYYNNLLFFIYIILYLILFLGSSFLARQMALFLPPIFMFLSAGLGGIKLISSLFFYIILLINN
jgi:hypothetical protein